MQRSSKSGKVSPFKINLRTCISHRSLATECRNDPDPHLGATMTIYHCPHTSGVPQQLQPHRRGQDCLHQPRPHDRARPLQQQGISRAYRAHARAQVVSHYPGIFREDVSAYRIPDKISNTISKPNPSHCPITRCPAQYH